MDSKEKQAFIQRVAQQNRSTLDRDKILWSRHGVTELIVEGWQRSQVEDALIKCTVIEDYPALHRPLPDCLVLGYLASHEPVHVVVGIDEDSDRLFVITVYKPSFEEWQDDWKTRK